MNELGEQVMKFNELIFCVCSVDRKNKDLSIDYRMYSILNLNIQYIIEARGVPILVKCSAKRFYTGKRILLTVKSILLTVKSILHF